MTWTHDDPAQGSPAAIQGMAKLRSSRATKIRDAQQALQSVASGSGAEWKAMSQTAFAAKLSRDAVDIELLAAGLEAQAAALQTYAGQLSQLKDRQRVLERQRRSAQDALAAAQQRWLFGGYSNDAPIYLAQAAGDEATAANLKQQKAVVQGQMDAARISDRAVDAQWDQLVADRRQIDATCTAALQNVTVLGALAGITSSSIARSNPASLLAMLSKLTEADLVILLKQHPELSRALEQAEPTAVAAWWRDLPEDQRTALIAGAPTLVGALDGVPALDRVAANKINAANRIKQAEHEIEGWRDKGAAFGQRDFYLDEVKALNREIGYLKYAVGETPSVQLYLYDHESDRIVEMLGQPSPGTNKVMTYVPGTFADQDGFYSEDTQAVAGWFQQRDPGMVAFVYKDGPFPSSIPQANSEPFAAITGKRLARFEAGVQAQHELRDAQQIGIGHSWGTANLTAAEVAGARFDDMISSSGAGVPSQWEPRPGTRYQDYSYYDVLQEAQHLPVDGVWGGRNPRVSGFEHGDYYQAPLGLKNYPLNDYLDPAGNQLGLLDAHNLIATATPQNSKVLNDMRESLYGHR